MRRRTARWQRVAMATVTGSLALGAWGAALVPASAQLEVPSVPEAPALPAAPAPPDIPTAPAAPALPPVEDPVNDTIGTVEDTVNGVVKDVTGVLPSLPVAVPIVDLPRVGLPDLPVDTGAPGTPGTPGAGGGAGPRGANGWSGAAGVGGGDAGQSGGDGGGPTTSDAFPVAGDHDPARAASGSGGTTGDGSRVARIAGLPVGNFSTGALPASKPLEDALPRWVVLLAAGLLTGVSLGLGLASLRSPEAAMIRAERRLGRTAAPQTTFA